MPSREPNPDEVDSLVRGLTLAQQADTERGEARPGTRWTNVRVQMPARRGPGPWTRMARLVAKRLPELPELPELNLGRNLRRPGPVAMVRLWVALGAVHAATMTFWPYPKTYFWGLVLYLFCLSVVLVAGIWGARLSWDARLGAAHTISVGATVWTVALAAAETLPPV